MAKQYAHLADYYERFFPVTPVTIAFLETQFKTAKTLLDVGCGTGLHALEMAKLGKIVIGIDPDQAMLSIAKQRVTTIGSLCFAEGRLAAIGLTGVFDGIMVLGNTLPHVADETELELALRELYDHLEEGGTLVLQLINYDKVFADTLTELPPLVEGSVSLRRLYDHRPPYVLFTTILDEGEKQHTQTLQLLGITQAMLHKVLEKVGFTAFEAYGDFSGKPYAIQTDLRYILVARKPQKGCD